MKIKFLIGLLLVLLMMLTSGCTFTKDFMVTIEREFVVNENATAFNKAADVDVRDYSSDFEKYAEDLKELEVVSASYTVTYHSGSNSQKVNSATLKIGATDGSGAVLLSTLNNVNLASSLNVETEFDVENAGENKLQDLALDSPYTFRYYFNGTVNESPLNFKVVFKLRCKVKYEKKIL
jgi:hypothetical protein